MIPIEAEKGTAITDAVKRGTDIALSSIKIVLEYAGSNMDKIVKVTVYLRDMADFNAMNEVYKTFFPVKPPARTCIAVKDIPGGAPLEIDVIAVK